MATTLSDIGEWAAVTYLNRPELLTKAIEAARDAYRLVCTKVPFEALQTTSSEQSMTDGTATYDISSFNLAGIVNVRATFSSTNIRVLKRSRVQVFDWNSTAAEGKPTHYARWANTLQFHPTPDASTYTYRLRYWAMPTIASIIGETSLVTPYEWDELLRWQTAYRMLHQTGQEEKAMLLVQTMPVPRGPGVRRVTQWDMGIIPLLWNDLLTTINQREHVDEDFSINPIVRTYSFAR